MTINEAIELIIRLQGSTPEGLATPMQQAIKLGIEALKVIKHQRTWTTDRIVWLLPGETEE